MFNHISGHPVVPSSWHVKLIITLGQFPWPEQMVESPRIHNSQRVAVGRPPMDIGEVFSLCSMRGQNWGGSCLSACGQESGLDHPSPSPYTNSNHFLFFAMENNRIWRRWMYLPNWGTSMNFFFFSENHVFLPSEVGAQMAASVWVLYHHWIMRKLLRSF